MMYSGPDEARQKINQAFKGLIARISEADYAKHAQIQEEFLGEITGILSSSEVNHITQLDDFYFEKIADLGCTIALQGLAILQDKRLSPESLHR